MTQDTNKKIIIGISIGLSIAAAVVIGIFIKNKLSQKKFEQLQRQIVIGILKKTRKDNYTLLKKVTYIASRIIAQLKMDRPDVQMIRKFIESPQSQLNIQQSFDNNYKQSCKSFNVAYTYFQQSLEFYTKQQDQQILKIIDEITKDYQNSIVGKLPEIKVTVPLSITKQILIQLHKKLTLKRYLLEVDIFRKIRGKTQEQIAASNQQLLITIPSPQEEQLKILQQQGFGNNNQPAVAVYKAAIAKFINDIEFKKSLQKIQNHYRKIFAKYLPKIQQKKITQNQLNDFEDQLIYSEWG